MASTRRLYRPHPQGRKSRGPAGRAGVEVRAGHQPPHRPDARPHRAADAARDRRRGDRVKRREFITLLGGAVSWPLAARAQQSAMPVVGFLSSRSANDSLSVEAAFHRGLGETGYVEGRNARIAHRWADGRFERLPALAAELVEQRVSVIAAVGGDITVHAAKAATTTIPIVMVAGDDPAKTGLVASLARPGGNITGVTLFSVIVEQK